MTSQRDRPASRVLSNCSGAACRMRTITRNISTSSDSRCCAAAGRTEPGELKRTDLLRGSCSLCNLRQGSSHQNCRCLVPYLQSAVRHLPPACFPPFLPSSSFLLFVDIIFVKPKTTCTTVYEFVLLVHCVDHLASALLLQASLASRYMNYTVCISPFDLEQLSLMQTRVVSGVDR